MKRVLILMALTLALPAITLAQQPDFSGTWKMNEEKSVIAQRGGGGGDIVIKQTKDTLTIAQSAGGNNVSRVYKLNGAESVNSIPGRGGATEIKTTSKWDGKKLVSVWQQPAGRAGAMTTFKESIYMDGANLVRETDGGSNNVTRLVFVKGSAK